MFDLMTAGTRHPFHGRTVAPQMLSIAVHAAVLSTVIMLPLMFATERLPVVPTMMAFVASPVAPPPSPPPPPLPKAAAGRPRPNRSRPISRIRTPPRLTRQPRSGPSRHLPATTPKASREASRWCRRRTLGGFVGGLIDAPPPPPPPPPAATVPPQPVRIRGQISAPELLRRWSPSTRTSRLWPK